MIDGVFDSNDNKLNSVNVIAVHMNISFDSINWHILINEQFPLCSKLDLILKWKNCLLNFSQLLLNDEKPRKKRSTAL